MTKPVTRKMAVSCLLYRFWNRMAMVVADDIPNQLPFGRAILICGICNKGIGPDDDIEFDHIHADIFEGPHEYQNLRPLHKDCHKKKTAKDIKANAKVKRLRGERKPKPKRPIPSRPMTSGAKQWPKRKMQSNPFQKRKI